MQKAVLRLNVHEFMHAQVDRGITNDKELAKQLGVSMTQIWRAKLPVDDPRHNAPGNQFIAGVLNYFGGPFEKFFYLDEVS